MVRVMIKVGCLISVLLTVSIMIGSYYYRRRYLYEEDEVQLSPPMKGEVVSHGESDTVETSVSDLPGESVSCRVPVYSGNQEEEEVKSHGSEAEAEIDPQSVEAEIEADANSDLEESTTTSDIMVARGIIHNDLVTEAYAVEPCVPDCDYSYRGRCVRAESILRFDALKNLNIREVGNPDPNHEMMTGWQL